MFLVIDHQNKLLIVKAEWNKQDQLTVTSLEGYPVPGLYSFCPTNKIKGFINPSALQKTTVELTVEPLPPPNKKQTNKPSKWQQDNRPLPKTIIR